MDLSLFESIFTGLKAAQDFAGSLVHTRDDQKLSRATAEIQSQLAEITEKLFRLQVERMDLLNKHRDALDEVKKLKEAALQRSQYLLVDLSSQNFAFKFSPNVPLDSSEFPAGYADQPVHYLCQPCLDIRGHSVILRQKGHYTPIKLECPSCKAVLLTDWPGKTRPQATRGTLSKATPWG